MDWLKRLRKEAVCREDIRLSTATMKGLLLRLAYPPSSRSLYYLCILSIGLLIIVDGATVTRDLLKQDKTLGTPEIQDNLKIDLVPIKSKDVVLSEVEEEDEVNVAKKRRRTDVLAVKRLGIEKKAEGIRRFDDGVEDDEKKSIGQPEKRLIESEHKVVSRKDSKQPIEHAPEELKLGSRIEDIIGPVTGDLPNDLRSLQRISNRERRYSLQDSGKSKLKSSAVYLNAEDGKVAVEGAEKSIVDGQIKKLISIRDDALSSISKDDNIMRKSEVQKLIHRWKEQSLNIQNVILDKNSTLLDKLSPNENVLPDIPKFDEHQLLEVLKLLLSPRTLDDSSKDVQLNDLNTTEINIIRYTKELLEFKQRQSFIDNMRDCIDRRLSIINCMRIYVWPIIADSAAEMINDNVKLPIEINLMDLFQGNRESSAKSLRLLTAEAVISGILKSALELSTTYANAATYVDPKNETLRKLLTPIQFEILQIGEKFLPEMARREYADRMFSCVQRFEYFGCLKFFAWPMMKQYSPALPAFPDYQNWYPTITLVPEYPILPFVSVSDGGEVELPEVVEADATRTKSKPETIIANILEGVLKAHRKLPLTASILDSINEKDLSYVSRDQLLSIHMAEQLLPLENRLEFVEKTIRCVREHNYLSCMKYSTWPMFRQFNVTLPQFPENWTPEIPTVPPIPETPQIPTIPPIPEAPALPTIPPIPEAPQLPTIPPIPETPQVPTVPPLPSVPQLPAVPELPDSSQLPMVPEIPSPPQLPTVPDLSGLVPGSQPNNTEPAGSEEQPTDPDPVVEDPMENTSNVYVHGILTPSEESRILETKIIEILEQTIKKNTESIKYNAESFNDEVLPFKLTTKQTAIIILAGRSIFPFSKKISMLSGMFRCLKEDEQDFINCTRTVIWPTIATANIDLPELPKVTTDTRDHNGLSFVTTKSSPQQQFSRPIWPELIPLYGIPSTRIIPHYPRISIPYLPGYYNFEPPSPILQARYNNFYNLLIPQSAHSSIQRSSNIDPSNLSATQVQIGHHGDATVTTTDTRFIPISETPETVILNILKSIQLSNPQLSNQKIPLISNSEGFNTNLFNDQQKTVIRITESLLPDSVRPIFINRMIDCVRRNNFLMCTRDVLWPMLGEYFQRLPALPNFLNNNESPPNEALPVIPATEIPTASLSETNIKTGKHGDTKVTITDTRFVPIFNDHPETLILNILRTLLSSMPNYQSLDPLSITLQGFHKELTDRQRNITILIESLLPEPERITFNEQMNICLRNQVPFLNCIKDIGWPILGRYHTSLPSFPDFNNNYTIPKLKPRIQTTIDEATLEYILMKTLADELSPRDKTPQLDVIQVPNSDRLTDRQANIMKLVQIGIPDAYRREYVTRMLDCFNVNDFIECNRKISWPTLKQFQLDLPEFPEKPMDASNPDLVYLMDESGQEPLPIQQLPSNVDKEDERLPNQGPTSTSVVSQDTIPGFPGQPTNVLLDITQEQINLENSAKNRTRRDASAIKNQEKFPNLTETELLHLLLNISRQSKTPSSNVTETFNATVKNNLTSDQYAILKLLQDLPGQEKNARGVVQQVISCITGLSFIRCVGIFVWPLITNNLPSLWPPWPTFPTLGGRSMEEEIKEFFGLSTADFEKELISRKKTIESNMIDFYRTMAEEKFESNFGMIKIKGYGDGRLGMAINRYREGRAKIKDNKNLPSILTIISDIMEEVLPQDKIKKMKEKKERSMNEDYQEPDYQSLKLDEERSANDEQIITMFLEKIKANMTEQNNNKNIEHYLNEDAYKAFEVLFGTRLNQRLADRLKNFGKTLIHDKFDPLDTSIRSKRPIGRGRSNQSEILIRLPKLNDVVVPRKTTNALIHLGRKMSNNNLQMMPGMGYVISFLLQMAMAHARTAATVASMLSNMALGSAMFSMIRQSLFGGDANNNNAKIKYVQDNDKIGPGIAWPYTPFQRPNYG